MNLHEVSRPNAAGRLSGASAMFGRLMSWIQVGKVRIVFLGLILLALVTITILAHARMASVAAPSAPVTQLPARIEVEVVNGTGEAKLAQRFTELLRSRGFDVVDMGNSVSPVQKSVVIDRSGAPDAARKVAGALRFPKDRLAEKPDKSLFLDVTVVIGTDYSALHLLQE